VGLIDHLSAKIMKGRNYMDTAEQLRAARAMTGLSQQELADLAGVHRNTIKLLESGKGPLADNGATVTDLKAVLEARGVVFVPSNGAPPGVRFRKPGE
jgi:DNA-binding XRE family transcriptional regulator